MQEEQLVQPALGSQRLEEMVHARALLEVMWNRHLKYPRENGAIQLNAGDQIMKLESRVHPNRDEIRRAREILEEKGLIRVDCYTKATLTEEGIARSPLLLGPAGTNSW